MLNEKQRKAKRKLIEDNREKRKTEYTPKVHITQDDAPCLRGDHVTEVDRALIYGIRAAYEESAIEISNGVSGEFFRNFPVFFRSNPAERIGPQLRHFDSRHRHFPK